MKATERATRVEYILKQEFAGRGWSKWMLTHASPGVPTSGVAQKQRAQNGVEAEIASRRRALEALSDDALERTYLRTRVRELEVNAELRSAKAKELEHENSDLRARARAGSGRRSVQRQDGQAGKRQREAARGFRGLERRRTPRPKGEDKPAENRGCTYQWVQQFG
ncbi:MAG TPA: hypothetical protein VF264_05070 [Rhodanobacteraceae bacterium]